jgi:Tol biopolymer transport system component
MTIDGKGLVNLTNNPASDYKPSYSPDQAWAAFTSDRDGNREVYLLTKAGELELYNLTNHPSQDQSSDWR